MKKVPTLAPVLLLAAAVALAVPVAVAQEGEGTPAEARTDPGGLAGYAVSGAGAPMTVLFYEPVIPAPVDPGEPHFELSESYTRATLTTGPTARAVASSVWPGPLVGDGMESFADGESYPVKADARYPQGPEEASQELPSGSGMRASARGLDVLAEATSGRSPSDEVAHFGNVASTSMATVEEGVARSAVLSAVSDVALLGGIVNVGSVRTTLEATSDGATGSTTGVTEVGGITIAGQGFTLDEEGPRPVQDGSPGQGTVAVPSALPGADEIREALGVELELLPQVERTEGADASRSAGGVRITIDTTKAREALNELPLADLIGVLPDEFQAEVYPLLSLSPRIVYIFGRASIRAAGTEPLDLSFPDLALPPPPPPPASADAAFDGFHGDAAGAAEFGAMPDPDAASALPPPGPEAAAPQLGAELPAAFEGLPPGVVALALGLTALAGYGLSGLTGLAFGGASALCSQGAVKQVPNLRRG